MSQFGSPNKIPVIGSHVLLIIFLVVSIGCMSVYSNEGSEGGLHRMQSTFSSLTTPLKLAGAGINSLENDLSGSIDNLSTDANTTAELKAQNAELREMVSNLEEYRQEAERLQELQSVKDTYKLDTLTCRVVGQSTDAWNRMIVLDKGSNDGIEAGMPVMSGSGVVGQVHSVSAMTCNVRLLQDPNSGAAVKIQSSRAQGVVRGSLEGLLYLEDVDSDVTVKVGDVVITSGLGGSYVAGLIVGTVVRVDQGADATERTIVVSPNDTTSAMEEVLVVFSDNASESDSSSSSSGGNSSDSSSDSNSSDDNTQG